MNFKVVTGILAAVTIAALIFGYWQKKEADYQRAKTEEMHRELVRLRQESEAARTEAAKLRQVIEIERLKAETSAQEAQERLKK
jgi:hypothetical protein